MLAKYWKKIGLVIVIVACVFNVMIKLINKLSFDNEMISSAQYVKDNQAQEEINEMKNHKNTEQNNTKKQK